MKVDERKKLRSSFKFKFTFYRNYVKIRKRFQDRNKKEIQEAA
jgi:hypothetical protein